MNKSIGFGCLALVVVGCLVLGLGGCSSYNKLVSLNEAVDTQWAQVENVYERRKDLIPNLVKTVEGQANFEKGTLSDIAEARASVGKIELKANTVPDESTLQQWEGAQARLGGALGRLMAVSENYPDLKANQGFMGLQAELAGTENRISVERGRFNSAAQDYNTSVKRFPAVLFAAMMGFEKKAYFKSSAGANEPPKVDFNFGNKTPASMPAPKQAEALPQPSAPLVPVPALPQPAK